MKKFLRKSYSLYLCLGIIALSPVASFGLGLTFAPPHDTVGGMSNSVER